MLKYLSLHFLILIVVGLFLKDIIIYLYAEVLNFKLISMRVNDSFQLSIRIIVTYVFWGSYFFFKAEKSKIRFSNKLILFSILGAFVLFLFVIFLKFLFLKLFNKAQLSVDSILPLWLTFPCAISLSWIIIKFLSQGLGKERLANVSS